MLSPNATQIESACENILRGTTKDQIENYPTLSDFLHDSQLRELQSAMGADTCKRLGIGFPLSEDFKSGYMVGIQAARVVLMMSVALMLGKIEAKDIL